MPRHCILFLPILRFSGIIVLVGALWTLVDGQRGGIHSSTLTLRIRKKGPVLILCMNYFSFSRLRDHSSSW